MNKITSIADVRRHFRNNKEPIYFISATNFNLLGIGDWVGAFRHINYIDCFEGKQRNVFVPKQKFPRDFESIEDINNYLLEHKEVIDFIQSRADGENAGVASFLMFDEHTEEICKQLGLRVAFPQPSCVRAWTTRLKQYVSAIKPACPACPTCWPRSAATRSW
ncbi:hypothetical protein [Vreelandella azerica]|uniref:hypothetical protein n=1 Tax=Vreelandella azerica TaxID=2732867 RepID=UPI001F264C4A|nr:hypothetical protein [Halomonas azerica]